MEFLNGKKKKQEAASTQKYLDISELHDNVIVLNDGSLRAILAVSSLNFELKSTEEQEAIISQYQGFLNSLDFPIQILISSRKINVEPYLEIIKKQEKMQKNELLRFQTSEYIEFIKGLTQKNNIMTKEFYVAVPFYIGEESQVGFFKRILALLNPRREIMEKKEAFETYKNQLWQRVDHVTVGITRFGSRVALLNTQEIIELLYNSYNPSIYTSLITNKIEDIELQ